MKKTSYRKPLCANSEMYFCIMDPLSRDVKPQERKKGFTNFLIQHLNYNNVTEM